MATYLEKNPPKRSQFRKTRRANPTGGCCVHTAESRTDVSGPDSGAENVARFIANRSTPGSYHSISDADSTVRLVPFSAEAYGESTGGNRWALHLSFACKAAQWSTLPKQWVAGAIEQGARAAAEMSAWIFEERGFKIPARRISPAQYRNGVAGFVGHGELDPGRRSDPGADFPWAAFLDRYAELIDQPVADISKPPREELVMALQRVLLAHGAENLGHTGPNKDGVDGDPGMGTIGDAIAIIESLADTAGTLRQTNHDLTTQVATLTIKHAEEVEALRAALGSGTVSYRRSDGLNDAVREVEALYQTHRGYDPTGAPLYTGAEIHEWRLDLHNKIYELGVDVHPTLAYIDWALANENEDND